MSRFVTNTPAPNVLMSSLRSIGYTFKTAVADIIDNSISAHAKHIFVDSPISPKKLFISFLDDGYGMTNEELQNAMKYGSNKDFYDEYDLGRFGLGLKSASLSQCRVLTVASKYSSKINAYQWNLDDVIDSKEWKCKEFDEKEIEEIPNIDKLEQFDHGTLVVWENFDVASKRNDGKVFEQISDDIEDAEYHVRLTFHRFMSSCFNRINIYFNNTLLMPFDPFLENNPKTDSTPVSEVNENGSIIKIQSFILPHQNDLTDKDIELMGGIESLKKGQGFYVYRNERLIIYGTWFHLSSNSVSSELYKYGRIRVDIPNSLDESWGIDVKKQHAEIPKYILNLLKKTVIDACAKSNRKSEKRVKLTFERDDNKIWAKKLTRESKDEYFINEDSKFIRTFLDEFEDGDRVKILRFVEAISLSLPYDDIYNSICNKRENRKLDVEKKEALILLGTSQVKQIVDFCKCSIDDAIDRVCSYEPFNNDAIKLGITEALNGKR